MRDQAYPRRQRRLRFMASVGRSWFGVGFCFFLGIIFLPHHAGAARGDCGQPISNVGRVTIGDCLFTLKASVALESCAPSCVCAVKGRLPVTASDALLCLQSVVGLPVALACPDCDVVCSDDVTATLARGDEALERRQLKRASEEYACAAAAAPTDGRANFFHAITRILEYFARDEELSAFLTAIGGRGIRDVYDFDFSVGGDAPTPTVAQMKAIAFGRLDEELQAALAALAVASDQVDFTAAITDEMVDDELPGNDAIEIDRSDAMAISALLHLIRFQLYFGLGSYSEKTIDDPAQDLDAVLRDDCGAAYLTENGDFFTLDSMQNIQIARVELAAGLDDLIAALDAIQSETDPQNNDLLLSSDIGNESASSPYLGVGVENTSERDILLALRTSLDIPVGDMPGCDLGLSFLLGNLFDRPLDRSDIPPLGGSPCKIVGEFPDPTLGGVFAGAPTRKELEQYASDLIQCTGVTGTAPANDRCGRALVIPSTPYFGFQATRAASVSANDPALPERCLYGGPAPAVPLIEPTNSVWYRFTAPASGIVRINTRVAIDPLGQLAGFLSIDAIRTNYSATVAVFTGGCAALKLVDCAARFDRVLDVNVVAGRTYWIEIADGKPSADDGQLLLTVTYRDR